MGKFQFFTTDSDFNSSWFPIDHFFYARKLELGQKEGPKVVHLETHASIRTASGMGVSVVSPKEDPTENPLYEEFDDIPSALRRMADIIEAHSKANVEVSYDDCDNCGSDEWDNGVCSLDGLGFCCEECLDAYLNGGHGGILSPNPQDRYNPEPYETSFYRYENGNYVVRTDIHCLHSNVYVNDRMQTVCRDCNKELGR